MFINSSPRDIDEHNGEINRRRITPELVGQFESLLNQPDVNERSVDEFLTSHPQLLYGVPWTAHTGHHSCWVYPKRSLRQKINEETLGLIPDFLIRGTNSNGDSWFLVELKGPRENILRQLGGRYVSSDKVTEGIWQLLEYKEFCCRSEMMLRDILQLANFRSPKCVLIVGREIEYADARKKRLVAEWNDLFGDRIHLMTYDRLLRIAREEADRLKPLSGEHPAIPS